MSKNYSPKTIEEKWQRYWKDHDVFKVEVDRSKPKYYVLDMFPYPSGAGLHVGHLTGYTATDVISRYKRQCGYNVLHPMGWDSFGLPAEQFAVRTGIHPSVATTDNINTYRRQLQSVGFSYDWSREVATSDPDYYKWTQWIFTKLYEKGLAYEAEAYVNFCPALGTVLANEEVENGYSVEGGYPVERRPLKQWILKITEYAERLLTDLDLVDWPEHIKALQRNWIGKSEGAKVQFQVDGYEDEITCFTTRHDTLFGVTFLVLAPEHPLVEQIVSPEKKEEVEKYVRKAINKNDLARTDLAKEKTGVFSGAYAVNPVNEERVPIWIADYVLISYGTGAVMGVPGHDTRDNEFVQKFGLDCKLVMDFPDAESCYSGEEAPYINSKNKEIDLSGLGMQAAKDAVSDFLEAKGKGERCVTYKLRDWLFSRQRYWGEPIPIIHLEDGSKRLLDLDELPLITPELEDYKPSETGESPLQKAVDWVNVADKKSGKKGRRETNIMPQWAGSCWYYLRFCDPRNDQAAWDKEKENYWMPVDLYVGGVEHAVLHLLYARFWHKVLYDFGYVSTLEPFQKLRNQGLITAHSYKKAKGGYLPEDQVVEKEGKYYCVSTGEEVARLHEKMSKSKLNGVSPDEMIEEYGADALRIYELFMSPFDKEKLWNTKAVVGSWRFLNRVYELVNSPKIVDHDTEEGLKLGHKLLKGVIDDIENMGFNTAIAKMMEFLNDFTPLEEYPRNVVKILVQVVYPFAPHLGEECWEILGEKPTIADVPLPEVDLNYLVEDEVTIVFQVKGKLRSQATFPKGTSKEEILAKAKADPKVQKHLNGDIIKEIYVPEKLVNIVTNANCEK